MKRTTAMLAGAATVALAAGGMATGPAMAEPIPPAASYADLLEPVPNAMERLAVADANAPARMELAQYDEHDGNYHHHHQYNQYRRYDDNGGRAYHHHHHHNRRWYRANGYYWYGGQWILRPVHHHHHHHHHHYDGY